MLAAIDHLVVAVADLAEATAAYQTLLGRAPSWRGSHPSLGTRNTLFRLRNLYVELLAADPGARAPFAQGLNQALGGRAERPFGLAFAVPQIDAAVAAARARGLVISDAADGTGRDDQTAVQRTWRSAFIERASTRGLFSFVIQHTSAAELLPPAEPIAAPGTTADGVDHVVVFSQDLDASRALWVDSFGLREDWRHEFPERGTRNLGLELGGIIVELIMRTDRPAGDKPDTLWGFAYQVADLDGAAARLRSAGIPVDPPRPGLMPDTRVATVRWPRTPTLLIARP